MTTLPIEENFLRASRGQHTHLVSPNGLFDANKILKSFPEGLAELRDWPLTALSNYEKTAFTLEAGPIKVLPKPAHSDSYVFEHDVLQSPPVPYFVLEDVYLSFDIRNNGAPEFYIFNTDKALINGLFFGAKPFVQAPLATVHEPSVLIDDFFVSPNICHFVFDKFPRWHIATKMIGPQRPVMFHPFSYVDGIFGLSDVTPVFLMDNGIAKGTMFFKSLVVFGNSINLLRHPMNWGHPLWYQAVQSLRDQAPKVQGNSSKRLMLTRAPGLPRQIQNMAEVASLMARHNVELIDPAGASPMEQLEMFSGCNLLIGVHGAGLTNLAFMPEGSKVIELLPPLCATKAYCVTAHFLGHNYDALTCIDPEYGVVDQSTVQHNPVNNRRDIIVPLDQLNALLEHS